MQARDGGAAQLRCIEFAVFAAALLGTVQRRIGIAQQCRDIPIVIRAQGDADTGRDEQLVHVDSERRVERFEHGTCALLDRRWSGQPLQQDAELNALETRQGIGGPRQVASRSGTAHSSRSPSS